jgi:DGQHR domain-containing protein
MLATQVRQKDAVFYFAAIPAEDLLEKVRFISRFYDEGGTLAGEGAPADDDIAKFIGKIERSDSAFQRQVSKDKVKAIRNFYETASQQPPIPGTVLLFTAEKLRFRALEGQDSVGQLQTPNDKFLIIDGQHRLAALHFYYKDRKNEAASINVPCVIFDGRSEDFATEMFVIINSTPTRINKSHLVDLYEKVSFASPDKRCSARVVELLYSNDDSPLQYRINRLGGKSKAEKWILQAELFNEVNRWVRSEWDFKEDLSPTHQAERYYEQIRDFFKASAQAWGETWGNNTYMVTKPVTLKALIRVCADLSEKDADPREGRVKRWVERLSPWSELKRNFRSEGFYERFPAKGQVERVGRIEKDLAKAIGL